MGENPLKSPTPESEVLGSLGSLDPFSPFSEAELAELAHRCEINRYDAGVTLITEGEQSDQRIYFILSGSVSVYVKDRYILTLDKPGDIVGEMSLVGDEPRFATVKTASPSRILVVSSALDVAGGQDGQYRLRYYFTRMFSAIMASKLRTTSERAKLYEDAILHSQRAEERSSELTERVSHNLRQIRLYSQLVDSAKEAILITSLEGVVERANPATGETFGLDLDNIAGVALTDLLAFPASAQAGWPAIAEEATGRGWRGEVGVRVEGLDDLPAVCTISLVREPGEGALAYSVFLRDLRERKAYEARILKQQHQLEKAYTDLQEMDKLKDHFMSRVSHELRTPLTSLLGSLEMMSMPGMVEPEEQGGYVEMMLEEAKRLAELVDKVLAISKIESGQMMFEFERGPLDEALLAEISKIKPRAEEKQLTVETTMEPGLEPVWFDEKQLRTAVEQILDNAVKFTDSGSIRIGVKQTQEETRISVQDTGCGIEHEAISTLFNRLGDLDDADNYNPNQGLGLGLPLSHLIVHAHSGRLLVNSAPGQGAVFTIGLPRSFQPAGE